MSVCVDGVPGRRVNAEAAVDLCRLSGVAPVSAIPERAADDGAIMRMPVPKHPAAPCDFPLLTIEHESRCCSSGFEEARVSEAAKSSLSMRFENRPLTGYWDRSDRAENVALIVGEVRDDFLVRVQHRLAPAPSPRQKPGEPSSWPLPLAASH